MDLDYTKLKQLRKEKGLTQVEMSNLICTTQSNYSKIEKGSKKIDSLETLANIASALEIPQSRLIGILRSQKNIQSAGMKPSEMFQVESLLNEPPLREDEFIYFSCEILEINKHDFKEYYPGPNLKNLEEVSAAYFIEYADMAIFNADSTEIMIEDKNNSTEVSLWLGDKKLGIIPPFYSSLVKELIYGLFISRAVIIENEDNVLGYYDTYMKVVFIATNAVNKSAQFRNGRFTSLGFMSQEEIEKFEEEKEQSKPY